MLAHASPRSGIERRLKSVVDELETGKKNVWLLIIVEFDSPIDYEVGQPSYMNTKENIILIGSYWERVQATLSQTQHVEKWNFTLKK